MSNKNNAALKPQASSGSKRKKYTRYTKAHLRHRNMRFWLFFLALAVLLVLGLMRVHAYFAEKLVEYEASYYTHVADEAFKVFSEKRFDELYEYETMTDANLEGKSEYVKYLSEVVGDGEIEYTEIAPRKANEKRFLVTVDGKAFAEFSLKKLENDEFKFYVIPITNSYPWGHELYEFDTIDIDSKNPLLYDYYVPSYATVSVNGRELDESYISGEDETLFYDGHLPSGVNGFTITHYSFECALGEPEVKVSDAEGKAIALNDEGEGIYRFEYAYDDEVLKSQFEDKAMAFLKQWCLYSTHNANKNSVTDLCIPGSRAANFIKNYEQVWITKSDKQSFENASSRNYTMIDGQVLACDASVNYITVTKGKTNNYAMSMRLYFYEYKGEWLLYDFEMMGDDTTDA
ncbi:MAG: hypothetical protein II920_06225 [Clostridia bacterium]|nr:hypothetical protein [Clostridia bacterium]